MLKYLTHKLRTHSINEDNNSIQEKIDGHDSGTESDGDLDTEDGSFAADVDLSMSSRYDTTSPTATVCSSESPAFLSLATNNLLMYDQNSSEEELEVINGPVAESASSSQLRNDEPDDEADDDDDDEIEGEGVEQTLNEQSPKRCSTTVLENRKRSLVQSSDDEVRRLLEKVPAPVVNFRTSPPLEALKPYRSHTLYHYHHRQQLQQQHHHQRSITPLILADNGGGIESIRLSCDSSNISSMDVRTISPPAKLFHCAVSPRRRPARQAQQRLQRPHRPCLDFDKMQQLKTRSVTAWRHNNDHVGELSVFCW